ncbi:tRNA uridine-5-carboxymethylaminomethyl(34) synthesis GTPase MnmE [Octadecabacter sp.]|nr:tRNA uridine-5-carboxymethylaminomethyl(34) synthesis GTPase MnmE [Octadecabacter sp.]
MDTIFALASAAGKAGVSVIRISGSDALNSVAKLGVVLADHDRKLVRLIGEDGSLIDEAFAISFGQGRSFTGEQVVELQTHGSPAVVVAVLAELEKLGLRHAEPGEFTRRAMESGALDLARVEGLADLIEAETEGQRRQAVRVFKGDLGQLTDGWRQKLVRAAALLEATIDFVDEDVPIDVYPEVRQLVESVSLEICKEAEGVGIRERVRDGFEVALIGPPNSGKSTLLNRLAGREAAITSDIAGTTRDVIEVRMDLGGLPVTVLDTAGQRDAEDELESIGIERGLDRAATADIRIHLSPDANFTSEPFETGLDIFVQSKADVSSANTRLSVSAITGFGVSDLIEEVNGHLHSLVANAGVATRRRHEVSLRTASSSLEVVLGGLSSSDFPVDLLSDDLWQAVRSLDNLIGRVDVENVLDEIFSSFCIGK